MKAMAWLCAALLAGCSANAGLRAQVDRYNQAQEQHYSPFRAVFREGPGGSSSMEMGAWAGIAGVTAANAEFQQRIFQAFQDQCGLARDQLREVRIVRHSPPTEWYEVWVFNDSSSRRWDKTSGLSVVMRFDPASNRSEVAFYGKCRV